MEHLGIRFVASSSPPGKNTASASVIDPESTGRGEHFKEY